MGRPGEAMRQALEARRRIGAELAKHPGDALFLGDLSVACQRLVNMKLAAADTSGAIEECTANVDARRRILPPNPTIPGTAAAR